MVAGLQDTDTKPTVLSQLITMIYVDNDVRNQSWFVVTVARCNETNCFCELLMNMQIFWHVKQSALLSLQVGLLRPPKFC